MILAVPNAALICAGLAQSALDASRNHALSACSESAYSGFSQNKRNVLREMILIGGHDYGMIPFWEQPFLFKDQFKILDGYGEYCAIVPSALFTPDLLNVEARLFGCIWNTEGSKN
jgi:hypothetical protein